MNPLTDYAAISAYDCGTAWRWLIGGCLAGLYVSIAIILFLAALARAPFDKSPNGGDHADRD